MKELWWYFIAVAVAALLFTVILMLPAEARQMTDDQCGGVAQDAQIIAEVRDGGTKEIAVQERATIVFKENLGLEDSYIQTAEDLEYMQALIHIIFSRPQISPTRFAEMVYGSCSKYGFGHLYEIAQDAKVI